MPGSIRIATTSTTYAPSFSRVAESGTTLVGIGGEHGGHPESIRFCHHAGLDYVSCSAPRVPIARLAAAQAKLREKDYAETVWI